MQKPPNDQSSIRGTFNAAVLVCMALSRVITPFMRADIGECGQGILTGVVGVLLFYMSTTLQDPVMTYFCLAWLLYVLLQRWTRPKDQRIHSRYEGRPALAMLLFPFIKDQYVLRRYIEPLIGSATGLVLMPWSAATGKLLMASSLSLSMLAYLDRYVRDRREREIIDAQLESEFYTEGLRDRLRR